MIKINDYFDKIYCINLDRATDRWSNCKKQFNLYNINVNRFSAIESENGKNGLLKGEIGCMKSHYEIIKKASEENLKNVFILEDDAVLVDNFNEVFDKMINQVPDDWDFIYLGGNHVGGLDKISDNIYKMKFTYTTHAIGIKNTMFNSIIETLKKEEKQVDVYYAMMMQYCNAYVIKPHLSYQRDGFSYIQNGNRNYNFLK